MSTLTCKLPATLDGRLADLARQRGITKAKLIREALEAKLAMELMPPLPRRGKHQPRNLREALGDGIGCIASGIGDLARNKKHLEGMGQ